MHASAEPSTEPNESDQWPDAPKIVSVRGCATGLLVVAFATGMSIAILRSRTMPTVNTAPFWGDAAMQAISNSRPVELMRPTGSTAPPELDRYHTGWIDMTELRDIGYFRRVFLADNNFDWSSEAEIDVPSSSPGHWPWAFVRFGDPETSDPEVTIAINIEDGKIGQAGGGSAVSLNENIRARLAYRLRLFASLDD